MPNKQRRRNGHVQAPRRYRAAQSSSKRRDETAAKSFGARPCKVCFRCGSPVPAHPVFWQNHNVCIFRTAPIVSPSRLSVVFSIFQRGKTPHAKAKATLQSPLFRSSPVPGTPRFYRRSHNVCILRIAPIVSPSRFLAVFSIFQRGKSLPYKNKSGLTKRDFAAVRPCQAHPVFYRRSHNVCILRISSLISPFSAFQQSFRFFCVENRSPAKTKAALQSPFSPRFARAKHTPFFMGRATMHVSFEPRRLFPFSAFQ